MTGGSATASYDAATSPETITTDEADSDEAWFNETAAGSLATVGPVLVLAAAIGALVAKTTTPYYLKTPKAVIKTSLATMGTLRRYMLYPRTLYVTENSLAGSANCN